MNYQETLTYIYAKLPMFSKVGNDAIKKGLDNITALCTFLGNPHKGKKFIHIAGTNGKGSVSHMLAAILQAAGYKTGLYTSPHLKDLRERIRVNGRMMDESGVVTFVEKIQPMIETIDPSFFEINVAMAFDYFDKEGVDIAVIETGMGGRLDSTNIITPLLSIITNIGLDHIQQLGNTLALIAGEKAGIIKQGIPVVIGETNPETALVFEKAAAAMEAPLSFADQVFHVTDWWYEKEQLVAEVAQTHHTDHRLYHLDLSGTYQVKNLLTVLQACSILQQLGLHLTQAHIVTGLQHAKKMTGLHGRWETIGHNPRVVLDVAHNEAGIQQLINQLELIAYRELHMVLGMVRDKDIDAVLQLLPSNAVYYFTQAQTPRALPGQELQTLAAQKGLAGNVFNNVDEALRTAKSHAHQDDLIIVCGSVFLVGEVSLYEID